jgi:heat shock protein HslJ
MSVPAALRIVCLGALAACAPQASPVVPQEAPVAAQEVPAPLAQPGPPAGLDGRWRILSVDGQAPAPRPVHPRAPVLSFTDHSWGGTAGCNSFGGLGLLADGHYAVHSVSSTLIGCHDLAGRQEQAISDMFFARPRVAFVGEDRVRFESPSHRVELERIGPNQDPPPPRGRPELRDTSWRVLMMDGEPASATPAGGMLSFGDGEWQGTVSCATFSGSWRREGDRIAVGERIATTEQLCPPDRARIDARFADLMRSNPRYLVGPNGELLLAGAGHALTGGRAE